MTLPLPLALWAIPVANLGGVARHALDVAREGIPGWRLVFLTPEGPLADALRGLGASVVIAAFGPDAGVFASARALRRTVRTVAPQVVHTHLAYADIVAALALRGMGVTLVSTEHGIAPDDGVYHGSRSKSAAMAWVHRARILAFDRLIAVCQSTKDVMVEKWHPARPIDVVLNGVDRPGASSSDASGTLHIASIARLAPEKGIDHLLRAFALVVEERPEALLTIAGTGPLLDELRALASELGIADRVEWPGHVDAPELLARTDVLVQLSVWENCSYSLLDAAAAGLGIVATPVGGNPEILPPECLTPELLPERVADCLLEQATRPRRPLLRDDWPSVQAMCHRLGQVYGEAVV